jgi:hypothetical protein
LLILRCTVKLLRELGTKPGEVPADPAAAQPYLDWHANLLRFGRQKAVLCTNSATCFSFLLGPWRKGDRKQLGEKFRAELDRRLGAEGFDPRLSRSVVEGCRPLMLARTADRSVVGTMTDLSFEVRDAVELAGDLEGVDSGALHHRLNRVPLGRLEYGQAIQQWMQVVGSASHDRWFEN